MMISFKLFSVVFVLYLQVLPSWEDSANSLKIMGARATIAQINETSVSIRVDHRWINLQSARWLADSKFILPEERYPQSMKRRSISIVLPLEQVKNSDVFPGPIVTLFTLIKKSFHAYAFNIPAALKSKNKTFKTGNAYGELRVDLKRFPVAAGSVYGVYSYTPGEVFDFGLSLLSKNMMGYTARFYSINSDLDKSVLDSVHVTPESTGPFVQITDSGHVTPESTTPFVRSTVSSAARPDLTRLKFNVDTSSLQTGGIFFLNVLYSSEEEGVQFYITMKMVYLQLRKADSPIPEGRVAMYSDDFTHQTIKMGANESHIRCQAFGIPTPNLQVRINGRPVHKPSAVWAFTPWGSMLTVYDIPVEHLLNGKVTCYAENAGDVAEMAIVVKQEVKADPELNKTGQPEADKWITCLTVFAVFAFYNILWDRL